MATKDSAQLTDEVLQKMKGDINDFFATHEQITSSRDYENKVFDLAQKFAASMVTTGVGKLPRDRNAKKKS